MWLLPLLIVGCGSQPHDAAPTEAEPLVCVGDEGGEVELTIQPYVQLVGVDSAWILWETASAGQGSRVEFGPSEELGEVACGVVVPLNPTVSPAVEPSAVHEVELTGLAPASTVYYRVRTGQTVSPILHFRTVAPTADEAPTRIVAFGDSQQDDRHPEKFTEVAQDGAIAYVQGRFGPDLATELNLVVAAGDLVDNGWLRDEWVEEFFAPAAELFAQVPLYPVAGNHEGNSPHYDRYFHLPGNEHHYAVDSSNVRLIGLDSNGPWDDQDQLVWLDELLDRTCEDPAIDFVVAQLHHPALSELWVPGQSDWSAQVVLRLELFSTDCGKPSVHLFGHTHAYSRGQSKEHRHLWVNVSGAGGAPDRWGEQLQADYDEFVASEDTYGFVVIEALAGDDPQFSLTRVSRGTIEDPADNEVTDVVSLRLHDTPPDQPGSVANDPDACAGPAVLVAGPFTDPDGDAHQASQWQIAPDCTSFEAPLVDRWKQDRNLYSNVDAQAGDDLTDEAFPELLPGQIGCWRVRYRDSGFAWSAWSTPAPFAVPSCP